jgi:Fur family transcriptional regulator, ferric uptake regulator
MSALGFSYNVLPVNLPASPSVSLNGIRIIEPLCAVFRRKLKSEGLKYTPERAQILDAIIRRDDMGGVESVFQADELLAAMRKAGFRVSKATIYRTIKLLAEAGIIQQVLFDAETAHYQLAYGRSSSGLLVNVDTREITPIELPELAEIRDRVCRERGLVAEGHRVVIYARGK